MNNQYQLKKNNLSFWKVENLNRVHMWWNLSHYAISIYCPAGFVQLTGAFGARANSQDLPGKTGRGYSTTCDVYVKQQAATGRI